MAEQPSLVHVEIFGQTYAVRAGADPGYVERLAAFVDGRMKEVARSTKTVDSQRIAVLAALNVADELFAARDGAHSGAARRPRNAPAGWPRGAGRSARGLRRRSPRRGALPYGSRAWLRCPQRSPALLVMDAEASNQRL